MCVIHEQGNIALEERCDGLEEGFDGDVTRLQVTGDADPTTSQQETVAALQADESIDAILAAGPVQAIVAVNAVAEVGRDVMIGNFDLSGDVIDAIENGEISFAIDQQQYLQGYLPVVFMYLQATNLNTVGGGMPILTGPGFVTQENAAQVRELAEAGTR
jgi:simple sugar transport system substrate-binding protein